MLQRRGNGGVDEHGLVGGSGVVYEMLHGGFGASLFKAGCD